MMRISRRAVIAGGGLAVDAARVLGNLKTYLETAHQPPVQAPPRPTGWLARLRRPREQKGTA